MKPIWFSCLNLNYQILFYFFLRSLFSGVLVTFFRFTFFLPINSRFFYAFSSFGTPYFQYACFSLLFPALASTLIPLILSSNCLVWSNTPNISSSLHSTFRASIYFHSESAQYNPELLLNLVTSFTSISHLLLFSSQCSLTCLLTTFVFFRFLLSHFSVYQSAFHSQPAIFISYSGY